MGVLWRKGNIFVDASGRGILAYYKIDHDSKPIVDIYSEDPDPLEVERHFAVTFDWILVRDMPDEVKETLPNEIETESGWLSSLREALRERYKEDLGDRKNSDHIFYDYDGDGKSTSISVKVEGSPNPDENASLVKVINLMKDIDLDEIAKETIEYMITIFAKIHLLGAKPTNTLLKQIISDKFNELVKAKEKAIKELLPSS